MMMAIMTAMATTTIVIMTMGSGRRERVGAAGQERERGCERCLEDVYRVGRNAGHVQDVSQYVLSSKSRSTRSGGGGGERGQATGSAR